MRPLARALRLTLALLPAAAAAHASALGDFAWLAGCWAGQGAEPGTEEHWLVPAGGSMLGVSRTVKQGRTTAYEFMQIREPEPGKIVFIAHPSGQPEASFPMVRAGENEIVFENPAHDFPQRIIYRGEQSTLRARIEGRQDGRPLGIDFPMNRVACAETANRSPK